MPSQAVMTNLAAMKSIETPMVRKIADTGFPLAGIVK
jgi:hypothetical protein